MTTSTRERPRSVSGFRQDGDRQDGDRQEGEARTTPRPGRGPAHPRVELAGVVVDLMDQDQAVEAIIRRASQPAAVDRPLGMPAEAPLAVISANLDHIVQFGDTGRWRHLLGDSLRPTSSDVDGIQRPLEWLTLLDGAPLVAQSMRLTGRSWPRLAGSDLVEPLLDAAEKAGVSVGFVGGSYVVQRLLSRRLTRTRPGLVVAGMWSPDRAELADDAASLRLATAIAEAGPQLLIVGLGKPRQELWISRYGPATGANVLLAFGAVVDFLADAIQRAPRVASDHGLEWAWRLAREPRRLAQRYLLDDPPGLLQLWRHSRMLPPTDPPVASSPVPTRSSGLPAGHLGATGAGGSPTIGLPATAATFVGPGQHADVAVLVVTYNSADHAEALIAGLRREANGLALRVIVADNASTDATLDVVARHSDVIIARTGGNLGYAAGLNVAARAAGEAEALLVLNPDLQVQPGAIAALLADIRSGVADLVVPRLVDADGTTRLSLYREPTPGTILGDAAFGARWKQRPAALAGTDMAPESYQFGHEIDWSTGAAVMVSAAAAQRVGAWDEQFFLYSEETDYFRRARDLGFVAWYEPRATMMHLGSGSGTSPELNALMAVNRVRYARKHQRGSAPASWAGVALGEALRAHRRDRRNVLATVIDEARWDSVPGPTADTEPADALTDFPRGAVIIPAHNESAVITRTLVSLEPALGTGRIEVIVVCNGCTDDTAALAAAVPGVQVARIAIPSKTAALNAGDAHATSWPRVYLDADTEISPVALRRLLEALQGPTLAARPAFRYDVGEATWPVRAYYRARRRLPSTRQALWGAGVFGLSEEGHARFGEFPDVTADDYFVDRLFSDDEKAIVPTVPVPVRTPQDTASLLRVLRRVQRGPAEQRQDGDKASSGSTARELVRSVRGPASLLDALTYATLAAVPRLRSRPGNVRPAWERDDSSRAPDLTAGGER